MKYYLFAGRKEINFDNVKKYMLRIDETERFALFCIDDENYTEFRTAMGFSELLAEGVDRWPLLGEDGALYSMNCGGIQKEADKSPLTLEANWKRLCKLTKTLDKDAAYRQKIFEKYSDGFAFKRKSVSGFNEYLFMDKENDTVISFRFRKAKKNNQPLVVYFGGGGTVGHDNFKPLYEFFAFAQGKTVVKADCNILIPQLMFGEDIEAVGMRKVAAYFNRIVRHILEDSDADSNRVYSYGISLGGKCVWSTLLDSPNLYAAAVEAMGMIYNYEAADLESIAHIPLWLAHSSDDVVVKIDSDDYCYKRLKELKADVRYTRWEKYGHKMSPKFYKNEPWLEWLLEKRK